VLFLTKKIDCYIDNFYEITVILYKSYRNEIIDLFLLDNKVKIKLNCQKVYSTDEYIKYIVNTPDMLLLNQEYYLVDDFGTKSYLQIGAVTRSPLFDQIHNYDGQLGINYQKDKTEFIVYTPVSKKVELEIVSPTKELSVYPLKYSLGCFKVTIEDNLEGYQYRYKININNQEVITLDPYAVSSDAKREYNYIIDWHKTYQFKYQRPKFSGNMTDMIIYEASIRDLTSKTLLPEKLKGTFQGLLKSPKTASEKDTALEYIASLGVTHLQLLPIFDFNIGNTDYNWGYNPEQYNVPYGLYASNPNCPYARINELKMLIDRIHKLGMRVSMDVVFNHVYDLESFSIQKLVPGYSYRYDENNLRTDSSGCGNDLATERKMIRKLIIDSICFWIEKYKISAFRIDLMGLIDIETINEIKRTINKYDLGITLYGEGWNMDSILPIEERSTIENQDKLPDIGHFNDKFRDITRTLIFNNLKSIKDLFLGSPNLFSNPAKSINYVECHDNKTLFDYLSEYIKKEENLHDFHKLYTQLVLVSQGVPFLHAGQEFYRTKQGIENSYQESDEINGINWEEKDKHIEYSKMVEDLIDIRKKYQVFRMSKRSDVNKKIEFIESLSDYNHLFFNLKGDNYLLRLIIKNDYNNYLIRHSGPILNIFDGKKQVNIRESSFNLTFPAIYIYKLEV